MRRLYQDVCQNAPPVLPLSQFVKGGCTDLFKNKKTPPKGQPSATSILSKHVFELYPDSTVDLSLGS
jgi:hypothetical protein